MSLRRRVFLSLWMGLYGLLLPLQAAQAQAEFEDVEIRTAPVASPMVRESCTG